ncbi:MAG: hypothetical protein A3E88_04620 [Legionellales bacterium RIFCSPHIGHO2_12_FULL_35_11]|nr:MAG: hypothetical protein A3E88_04620 [Legionellales bacterium RIFCSPHIGHO2_12_FULL_35_11]
MQIIFGDITLYLSSLCANSKNVEPLIDSIKKYSSDFTLYLFCNFSNDNNETIKQEIKEFYDIYKKYKNDIKANIRIIDNNNLIRIEFDYLRALEEPIPIEQFYEESVTHNLKVDPSVLNRKNQKMPYVSTQQLLILPDYSKNDVVAKPEVDNAIKIKAIQERDRADTSIYITRDNFQEHFPELQIEWDQLIGSLSSEGRQEGIINSVAKDVIDALSKNNNQQLVLDNLPVVLNKFGGIEKRVRYYKNAKDNTYYLDFCYDGDYLFDSNEYTPKISKPKYNIGHSNTVISPVTDQLSSSIEPIKANFLIWFKQFVEQKIEDSQNKSRIENKFLEYFDALHHNSQHLVSGLYSILFIANCVGALRFLRQLNSMDSELFAPFLEFQSNYAQFATKKSIDRLSDIARMSSAEKIWWKSLVTQHQKSGFDLDFDELSGAFFKFKNMLADLKLTNSLPSKAPISLNMQLTLDAASWILSKNPTNNQLHALSDLDLSKPYGAYFASRYGNLSFIHNSMYFENVTYEYDRESKIINFSMEDDALFRQTMDIKEDIKENILSYDLIAGRFFRRMVSADNKNLEIVFEIINFIRQEKYTIKTKSYLLYIAAMVGFSSSDSNIARQQYKDFIQKLKEVEEKQGILLADIVNNICTVEFNPKTVPNLSDLTKILSIIADVDFGDKDRGEVICNIFSIIKSHGTISVELFDNLSELEKKSLKLQAEDQLPAVKYSMVESIVSLEQATRLLIRPEENFDENTISQLMIAFSLISYNNNFNEAYNLIINKVKNTADINERKLFLDKLCDIHIGLSKRFLNYEKLAEICNDKIPQDIVFGRKHKDLNGINLKKVFAAFAKEYELEKTYLGNNGEKSEYESNSLLHRALRVVQLKDWLDELINGSIIPIINKSKNQTISETEIINGFSDINETLRLQCINYSWSLSYILPIIKVGIKDKAVHPLIDKYQHTFCLSSFINKQLLNCSASEVEAAVTKVLGDNKEYGMLQEHLISQVKNFRPSIGFKLAVYNDNLQEKFDREKQNYNREIIEINKKQNAENKDKLLEDSKNELLNKFGYYNTLFKYGDKLYFYNIVDLSISEVARDNENSRNLDNLTAEFGEIIQQDTDNGLICEDGCKLINIDRLGDGTDIKQQIYDAIKLKSIRKDALVSYNNKLYFFANLERKVIPLDTNDQHSNLVNKIKEIEQNGCRDASEEELLLIQSAAPQQRLHSVVDKLKNIGLKPLIQFRDLIESFNDRLNNVIKFTDTLSELKSKESDNYLKYLNIIMELCHGTNNVPTVDCESLISICFSLQHLFSGESNVANQKTFFSSLEHIYGKIKNLKDNNNDSEINTKIKNIANALNKLVSSNKNNPISVYKVNFLFENIIENILTKNKIYPIQDVLNICEKFPGVNQSLFGDIVDIKGKIETQHADAFICNVKNFLDDEHLGFLLTLIIPAVAKDNSVLESESEKINKFFTILSGVQISDRKKEISKIFEILKESNNHLSSTQIYNILNSLTSLNLKNFEEAYGVLFKSRPYPSFDKFVGNFAEFSSDRFKEYLDEFDKNPYDLVLSSDQNKFDTERLPEVVAQIKSLIDNQHLDIGEQEKLIQEFLYINALGSGDHVLFPQDGNGTILKDWKDGCNLHKAKVDDLEKIAKNLIECYEQIESKLDINNISSPDPKHRVLTLQLLAVFRTLYEKKAKHFPRLEQIIVVLVALDNPKKQKFRIDTGEGKSVITALTAALMAAKGCTVLVETANEDLANQALIMQHNDFFFESLGIKSKLLSSNTPDTYLKRGVTYGSSTAIKNTIAKFKLDGESLLKYEVGGESKLCLISDEYDYNFSDPTQCGVAIRNKNANSDQWIIRAINEFVDKDDVKQTDIQNGQPPYTADQILEKLKSFLQEKASGSTNQIISQKELSEWNNFKLLRYFRSANNAKNPALDKSYFKHKETDGSLKDVPFGEDGGYSLSNNFTPDLQSMLHVNNKEKTDKDSLQGDSTTVYQISNKSAYNEIDCIIGVSATNKDNPIEQYSLGTQITAIPPSNPGKRKMLPIQAVAEDDLDALMVSIINAIRYAEYYDSYIPSFLLDFVVSVVETYNYLLKNIYQFFGKDYQSSPVRPIWVFVERDNVDEVHKKLVQKFSEKRVDKLWVTTDSDEHGKAVKNSVKLNKITVVPPCKGRGLDPKPENKDGLFVIDAHASSAAEHAQKVGRSARGGKNGMALIISPSGKFTSRSILESIFGISLEEKQRQVAVNEQKAILGQKMQDYYLQQVADIKEVVTDNFDIWRGAFFASINITSINISEELISDFHLLRGEILSKLNNEWDGICNKHNTNNCSNPYIRLKDGVSDRDELDKALSEFQKRAIELWNNDFQTSLEDKFKSVTKDEGNDIGFDKKFLELSKLSDRDFNSRKLSLQHTRKKIEITPLVSAEITKLLYEKNKDGTLAILKFEGELSDYKRLQKHLKSRIDHFISLYPKLSESEKDLTVAQQDQILRLGKLVDKFDSEKDNSILLNILPFVNDMVNLFSMLGNNNEVIAKLKSFEVIAKLKSFKEKDFSKIVKNSLTNKLKTFANGVNFFILQFGEYLRLYRRIDLELLCEISDLENTKSLTKDNLYKKLHKFRVILNNNFSVHSFLNYFFGLNSLQNILDESIDMLESLSESKQDAVNLNNVCEEGIREGYMAAYLPDNLLTLGTNTDNSYRVTNNEKYKVSSTEISNKIKQIISEHSGLSVFEILLDYVSQYDLEIISNQNNSIRVQSPVALLKKSPLSILRTQLAKIVTEIRKANPNFTPVNRGVFLNKMTDNFASSLGIDKAHIHLYPGQSGLDSPHYNLMIDAPDASLREKILNSPLILKGDKITASSSQIEQINAGHSSEVPVRLSNILSDGMDLNQNGVAEEKDDQVLPKPPPPPTPNNAKNGKSGSRIFWGRSFAPAPNDTSEATKFKKAVNQVGQIWSFWKVGGSTSRGLTAGSMDSAPLLDPEVSSVLHATVIPVKPFVFKQTQEKIIEAKNKQATKNNVLSVKIKDLNSLLMFMKSLKSPDEDKASTLLNLVI